MSTTGTEIVVGIDFGTTFSGVSWALNEGQKKIRLITDWFNSSADNNRNDDKVPSVISYKNSRVDKWGYEVTLRDAAFRWIKILLEPQPIYGQTKREVYESDKLLRSINKTAEEVVCDYLKEIWAYTKEDIRKRVGDDQWESTFTVHIVLTVPAIWSHAAKDRTQKAAKAAGLPSNLHLVIEPEAAALATLRDKAEEKTLKASFAKSGDVFVVCDAGGGTVDLISYQVDQVKPLQVKECVMGDGGLCGSVFLDIAFERTIKTLVGEEQYSSLRERDKKHMLATFENGVKRSFTLESTKDFGVELRGVKDNEEEGISDDFIPLKHSMLRTVFDHVCGQIDVLVENQIKQVRQTGLSVKAILLVGGFGSSKYLHKHLESAFSSQNITVLQIDGAWSAICRGACMWGLEHLEAMQSLPSPTSLSVPRNLSSFTSNISRISKYSYGICLALPFDGSRHLWQDRQLDPSNGSYLAVNQMLWLLRRGERVQRGRTLNIDVRRSVHGVRWTSVGSRSFSQSLMFCSLKEPPSRKNDSVKELCSVDFQVPEGTIWHEKSYKSSIVSGKWRDMHFELSILLGCATLEYNVKYRGELVGQVEAKYKEEF